MPLRQNFEKWRLTCFAMKLFISFIVKTLLVRDEGWRIMKMQVILYHSVESKLQQNFKLMWAELTIKFACGPEEKMLWICFQAFFFVTFLSIFFTLNELSFGHKCRFCLRFQKLWNISCVWKNTVKLNAAYANCPCNEMYFEFPSVKIVRHDIQFWNKTHELPVLWGGGGGVFKLQINAEVIVFYSDAV